MVCPVCGVERNFVVDKRDGTDSSGREITIRTRECMNCHQKFKTKETVIAENKKSKEMYY